MYIFICTKPLQIMVAMIISKSYLNASLYIVSEFISASEVSESKVLAKHFRKVFLFDTRQEALKKARKEAPRAVFIDSDIGLRRYFQLLCFKIINPHSEVHVYEEGTGTYRTNLVRSKLKKAIYRAIGAACYFGDSFTTKKIHVFDAKEHRKKLPHLKQKQIQIFKSISDFVGEYESEILTIFCKGFNFEAIGSSGDAYIYMSDWHVDEKEIVLITKHDNAFIKLHPHNKEAEIQSYKAIAAGANWIPGVIPAEVVLSILSKRYDRVFVRHKNSSAVKYMSKLRNVIEY